MALERHSPARLIAHTSPFPHSSNLRAPTPLPPGIGPCSTNSYILAPALVEPRLVAKASALMALSHQVSHLLGLGLAVVLAIVLYGNISGDL